MKITQSSVSPSVSVASTSISTLLSSSVSAYLCLPPPVCSVHFSIGEFGWCIAVEATLRDVNEMLGIGWLAHQPCHDFDDVSTPVFERALGIAIPSQILESV